MTSSFQPLQEYREYSQKEMLDHAKEFYQKMKKRRTVRQFSDRPFPREIIDQCIQTAGLAPSGANHQPWHFVVVSDRELKQKIRSQSEKNERHLYDHKAPEVWKKSLAPLNTNAEKSFLETAPCLIVVFEERYTLSPEGKPVKNYYTKESIGIATGMLITAIHLAGLVTVTYTPSPMNFLNTILDRPINERAFIVLPIGYPAEDAKIPCIQKKSFQDIVTHL